MSILTIIYLTPCLVPATALLLLTSHRRWIALALCALPPFALWLALEGESVPLFFLSGPIALIATLWLVLLELYPARAERAPFLRRGALLVLFGSILPVLAVWTAAEHNPQGEFCRVPPEIGDCPLDYLKLGGIGLLWWTPIQTFLFLLVGEIWLIQVLFRRWKAARWPARL